MWISEVDVVMMDQFVDDREHDMGEIDRMIVSPDDRIVRDQEVQRNEEDHGMRGIDNNLNVSESLPASIPSNLMSIDTPSFRLSNTLLSDVKFDLS